MIISQFNCDMQMYAQQILDKDSLLQVLKKAPYDTSKIYLLIDIGQQYENNQPDSAIYYYLKSKELSEELKNKRGILAFIANYTYVLNQQGKSDSSLILNLQAVEIALKLNDKKQLARAYGNVGSSYVSKEFYEKSIEYYLKASKLMEEIHEVKYLAVQYSNLCNLYVNIDQSEKSVLYGEKAIKVCTEINDVINLGLAYNNTGSALIDLHRYPKGIEYLNKALEIANSINDKYIKLSVLLNISNAYIQQNQYDKIKTYCAEALQLADELGEKDGQAIAQRGLGYFYYYQKLYPIAELYAKNSLLISINNDDLKNEGKAYLLLANISGSKEQLYLQAKYMGMNDSIEDILLNSRITKNIQELETIYETEKNVEKIRQLEKEKALQDLIIKQKNTVNLLLTLSVIGVIILSFFVYRYLKQLSIIDKQKISELQKEKEILISKALLKGQEDERSRLARDLHDGLGGMLTGVKYSLTDIAGNKILTADNVLSFQRVIDMLDSSINEMRRIAHNMMPEALIKFGLDSALRDYCTDINTSGTVKMVYQSIGFFESTLEQSVTITLYRIVQELINNILKHAVAEQAIIQLQQIDNRIMITVEDNGKGFEINKIENQQGMGWNNIRSRVDFLKGNIDLQSAPGKGTSVNIEIKL